MTSKKILVVGQGFAGLCTAIVLRQQGLRVLLTGLKADPLMASTAAHGASTIKGLLESSQELFALKMKGHQKFLAWLHMIEELSNVSVPKILGVYEPFWTREQFSKAQARIYKNRFLGAFQTTNSTLELLKERAYWVNHYPGDFWVDTDCYLEALHVAAINSGVEILPAGQLISVNESPDGVLAKFQDGKHYQTDACVISTGASTAWIQGLGETSDKLLGASGWTFKGQTPHVLPNFCVVKDLNAAAIYANEIFLGSTTEDNGLKLSTTPRQQIEDLKDDSQQKTRSSEILKETLMESFPLESMSLMGRWGVRVRTKGRLPLIGPLTIGSRIYLNTGYYKSGLTLTPLGAKIIADQILAKP